MTARSLVLITIDCLRADHVGFLGYSRPTTPCLDSLAGESVVFRNAIAAGSPTYYALPALLASRYPLALGRDVIGLAPDESTIASALAESGFATAAFAAGNPYVSRRFGYDCGFDAFHDFIDSHLSPEPARANGLRRRASAALSQACHQLGPLGAVYDELYFRYCQQVSKNADMSLDDLRRYPAADEIVKPAISWLKKNSGRRFFLWLHFMDPHAPYFPKASALENMGDGGINARKAMYLNSYWNRGDLGTTRLQRKRELISKLYDAGIRFADDQIRVLTSALRELGVWDGCALAVTADHGEEFLDHGGRFHMPFKVPEELIHVPLQVRIPGHSGTSIEDPVSMVDLAPTLLDILDVPAVADFRGQSWWSRTGIRRRNRPVVTECVHGSTNPFHRGNRIGPRILSLRKDNYKLVSDFSAGSYQLFDLAADPQERNPLSEDSLLAVRKQMLDWTRKHVAESYQSRDSNRRVAVQLRDLRLEWAQPAASVGS